MRAKKIIIHERVKSTINHKRLSKDKQRNVFIIYGRYSPEHGKHQ